MEEKETMMTCTYELRLKKKKMLFPFSRLLLKIVRIQPEIIFPFRSFKLQSAKSLQTNHKKGKRKIKTERENKILLGCNLKKYFSMGNGYALLEILNVM